MALTTIRGCTVAVQERNCWGGGCFRSQVCFTHGFFSFFVFKCVLFENAILFGGGLSTIYRRIGANSLFPKRHVKGEGVLFGDVSDRLGFSQFVDHTRGIA